MVSKPKLIASLAVVSVAAVVVIAGSLLRPEIEPSDPVGTPGLRPGSAAMRATINPETGELEVRAGAPTGSLDPATRQAMRHDDEGLEQVFHPDGSVSVDLKGRFQSASVARIDEEGTLVICTEHADALETILEGSAPRVAKIVEVQ